MRRDDFDLETELRDLRPLPRPAFTAKLDARVADGFPSRSFLDRLATRLQATPPRRALLPVAATAALAVVVATVVMTMSEPGSESASRPLASEQGRSAPKPRSSNEEAGVSRLSDKRAGAASSGGAGVDASSAQSVESASGPIQYSAPVPNRAVGPFAAKADHREVERSAELVLSADPSEVDNDAARVFGAVHAANGIVLSSSIRDEGEGAAGARFELLIPAEKLGDALAALSSIAEVRSRHEATQDITAPTIGVGERLRESQARIDGLLGQLAEAGTAAERTAAEAELRTERRHRAGLRSHLTTLHRRANLSRVSLRIDTGRGAADGPAGSWGVGDALGDAGHILAVATGVVIVGLAIVGPLALIALLAWLAHRSWTQRARQRTLS